MSDAQLTARTARYELEITAERHAAFRARMLEQAVQLAATGNADGSYRKLLMVVALDGVRKDVLGLTNDAEFEAALTTRE